MKTSSISFFRPCQSCVLSTLLMVLGTSSSYVRIPLAVELANAVESGRRVEGFCYPSISCTKSSAMQLELPCMLPNLLRKLRRSTPVSADRRFDVLFDACVSLVTLPRLSNESTCYIDLVVVVMRVDRTNHPSLIPRLNLLLVLLV